MKKLLIALGVAMLVVVLVGVIAVFALSSWFKSAAPFGDGTPRDLGVTYTEEDYNTGRAKVDAGMETGVLNTTFSDAEVTALLNACAPSTCLLTNAQWKTSDDGLIEISGVMNKDDLESFIQNSGVSTADQQSLQSMLGYLPESSTLYASGSMQGSDDEAAFEVDEISFGKFPLPTSLEQEIAEEITAAVNERLEAVPGTQLNSFLVTESGVGIDVVLPSPQAPDAR